VISPINVFSSCSDELKLKFYELDGFKKAHEGKLSSASESDMKRALMQVEKANKRNVILQQKLNELQETNLKLSNESEKHGKDTSHAQKLKSAEDMVKTLKMRNDELLSKCNEMAQETSILARQFNALSDEKVRIQSELEDLKANYYKNMQSATAPAQDEIHNLKQEIENLKKLVSKEGPHNKTLAEEINALKAASLIHFESKLASNQPSTLTPVNAAAANNKKTAGSSIPKSVALQLSSTQEEILASNDLQQIQQDYLQQIFKIHELKEIILSLHQKLNQLTNNNHNILVGARTRPPTEQEIVSGKPLIIENYSHNGLVNVFDPKANTWRGYELDYHWCYDIPQKRISTDLEFLFYHILPNPFELMDPHYSKDIIRHSAILCCGEQSSGKTYTAFGKDNHFGVAFLAIEKIFSILSQYKSALKNELSLEYKHYNVPYDCTYDYSIYLSLYEIFDEKLFNGIDEGKGMKRFDLGKKIIYDPKLNQIGVDGLIRGQISDYQDAIQLLTASLASLQNMPDFASRHNKTNTILEIAISIKYLPGQQPIRAKFIIGDLASTNVNNTVVDHSVNAFQELFESLGQNNKKFAENQGGHNPGSPGGTVNNNFSPPSSPQMGENSSKRNSRGSDYSKLPFDGSKLTRVLQPLFHPLSKQLIVYHLSPTDASYEIVNKELTFAKMIKNSTSVAGQTGLPVNYLPPPPPSSPQASSSSNAPLSPSMSFYMSNTKGKELKDLEKQLLHINTELRETKRKNEIAEKGLNETKVLAEELVKQLNDGNKLLLQRYVEEKDMAKQLKHDLALTQRNLKKAIGETQEQRKINERLVKLVKGLEDERNSLNALVGEN
jgi:hypothetical protein